MELTLSFRVQSAADVQALSTVSGPAADRHAAAIVTRVTAVETVAGLDDVLADAAQTLACLPDAARRRVVQAADTMRAFLIDAPEPEDNASVLEAHFPADWPADRLTRRKVGAGA